LERLKETHDVNIIWHAFELRPKGSPPISPEYRARIESMRPQFRKMAKENYDVEINSGPFGIDSRPSLIGEKYAEAQGEKQAKAYHEGVAEAYWIEAKDISDLKTLKAIAESAGMSGEAFVEAIKDPQYETQVDADVEIAHQYGLSGVPALIFDNKYLVSGAQPLNVLKDVVEKVQDEANEP